MQMFDQNKFSPDCLATALSLHPGFVLLGMIVISLRNFKQARASFPPVPEWSCVHPELLQPWHSTVEVGQALSDDVSPNNQQVIQII